MANQYMKDGNDPTVVNTDKQEELVPPKETNNSTDIMNQVEITVSVNVRPLTDTFNPPSVYTAASGATMPHRPVIYEFNIQQAIVGRLIGHLGAFVNRIRAITGANILVKRHPTNTLLKIGAIEGLPHQVENALEMIKVKFPSNKFPQLSLDQVNVGNPQHVSVLPINNRLLLIEGVSSDVIVSNVTSLSDIFLQHPCHPTYPTFVNMNASMNTFYEETAGVPRLLLPFSVGVICVARVFPKKWYRAEVTELDEAKEMVKVKLVDTGGYHQVPLANLRQIRADFVNIPFQATDCGLANIAPLDKEVGWSNEAIHHFKYLTGNSVLRAFVAGFDVDHNRTLVHLFKLNGKQPPVMINKELANYGLVKWRASEEDSLTTTGVENFHYEL